MMSSNSLGRELIQLVQIDQDFCNNTYGVAPCSPQTSDRFNFRPQSKGDMPSASFAGDFLVSGTVRVSNTSTVGWIVADEQDVSKNVLQIRCVGAGSQVILQMIVYQGTTVSFILSRTVTQTNQNIDFEAERVGTNYIFTVNSSTIDIDIGVAPTLEVDQIGYLNNNSGNTFDGQIFDLSMTGITGGDRFYAIDDNSTTLVDSISSQNATLTYEQGFWTEAITEKCFNTFATCQDKENYDKGTKTLTFKKNQSADYDINEYQIPTLVNFSVTMPELNIFSRDTKNQDLGKFGKCNVGCKDLLHSDNHVDPYVSERNYNPLDNGTFWTKWLARNPYYEGWKIRLYDGQLGQALNEMNVREYELEKISNPDSNGNVKITATDLMRRLDKDRLSFPPSSNCRLLNNIAQGQTTFDTFGGLTDYTSPLGGSAGKYMLIGSDTSLLTISEITSETDNGDGTFTYTVGRFPQSPEFEAGTRCENAFYWQNAALADVVVYLLLLAYDSSEINETDIRNELANIEDDYNFLTNFLTDPIPVGTLLGNLAKEIGFYFWYDDLDQQIKLKTIRDEDSSVDTLDQDNNLIKDSVSSKTISDDRISSAYYIYSSSIYERDKRYFKSLLTIDSEANSDNEYGSGKELTITSDWVIADTGAISTNERLLQMFRDPTRTITFELDIKDDLRMGQVFKLAWRGYTDIYGNDEIINWICTGRTRSADRLKITAQEFKFNVPEV